jgi:hypothetical protein
LDPLRDEALPSVLALPVLGAVVEGELEPGVDHVALDVLDPLPLLLDVGLGPIK